MFTVLSCNIRKSDADDGADDWAGRSHICRAVIGARSPDIVCFQEMRLDQFADMRAAMDGFAAYGLPRTLQNRHPVNAIFFSRKRFDFLSAGGFWLSEKPWVPGSSSWGSASIRLANWLELREKGTPFPFRIYNTHLDHGGEEARLNQARLLLSRAGTCPGGQPCIITGDFNAGRDHPVLRMMEDAEFRDSYREARDGHYRGNTFHGFQGEEYSGRPGQIDWVMLRGNIRVLGAEVIRDRVNGRYPSDHYFLEARLAL